MYIQFPTLNNQQTLATYDIALNTLLSLYKIDEIIMLTMGDFKMFHHSKSPCMVSFLQLHVRDRP